jgi:hypothetical protein
MIRELFRSGFERPLDDFLIFGHCFERIPARRKRSGVVGQKRKRFRLLVDEEPATATVVVMDIDSHGPTILGCRCACADAARPIRKIAIAIFLGLFVLQLGFG